MRFVLYSDAAGVYLGSCLGLGFWSKFESAGQDEAVTFPDECTARAVVASWDHPPKFDWRVVPVCVSTRYATIADCVAAGLPGWSV